jgi:ATP-binding cassette subfamily C protein CydC
MKQLFPILRLIWRGQPGPLLRGTALAVTVLAAGVALLGLSGWFITAAGAAGLAGIGIAFNVFQPSAGVRLLALGRTAARYGERLLTHDATLKSLAEIRVRLLKGVLALPYTRLSRLRGAEVLNRLVADVDALDGIALRLFIPAVSAAVIFAASYAILGWLTTWAQAAWIVGSFALGSLAALAWVARRALAPSRRAEKALQAFRIRLIDTLRARDDLAVYGRLAEQTARVHDAEARLNADLRRVDQVERRAGLMLSATATLAAGGALWLGGSLAQAGVIEPARAALGFFATLALAETTGPLRRGLAELGRMVDAARRVNRLLPGEAPAPAPLAAPGPVAGAPALAFHAVTFRHPGAAEPVLSDFGLTVQPGETVALTGPSGGGKSTVLGLAAGLITPEAGEIALFGQPLAALPEHDLRAQLTYLPQRSALLGRSLYETLALADPELSEAQAEAVLEAMQLDEMARRRGGLHAPLKDNGAGLSGGEQRRLALARALLRRPGLLLLDEPTEGLDRDTASMILFHARQALPHAAIVVAAHRAVERQWADRVVDLAQA